jgi:hypothetical protein
MGKISRILLWTIPFIGFLVAAAMWGLIFWTVYEVMSNRVVQFNPVNTQNLERNHRAARAHTFHGILWSDHNGIEYGFERDGRWCSTYRSLP